MTLATGGVLALAGSSACTDLFCDKIYNGLVIPGAVLGLVLAGPTGCGARLVTMGMVLALFLPFWMCLPGSIGGGDIKLYLAMAALLERRAFLILLFVSLAGAGAYGVLRRLLLRGRKAQPSRVGRIRIGPAVFCAALLYAGGFYG